MSSEDIKIDPRIKRTKKMFKQALISLIREDSDQTKLTVQRIADRAELNRATFYLHYDGIDDLMEQMIEGILDEMYQTITIDAIKNSSSHSPSYPALTSFLEHFYQNAGLYHVMLENKAFHDRVFGMLLDIITLWGEERIIKGRPFHVLNEVIASSTLGIVTWWLKERTPYSPNYMAHQITLLVNGEK
ncbi:TetR/AcrR family transcriptional regulator [Paenibacillus sp. N3/727]|uniref:TetR/AcrR family transcriptional regulator n=1 Tax=Paenibacillus sp. N3/727 TaxID=2925845 RepID=UPI001F53032D|nr:TetR/AcrR family transcriptional regulator [Paenibacillus sp. N3/727]UNK16057.1 TetR/AcrR family transcriptional regulator [Paenibacillus sp. N3/727]